MLWYFPLVFHWIKNIQAKTKLKYPHNFVLFVIIYLFNGDDPTKVVIIISEKIILVVFVISNLALLIWLFYGVWLSNKLIRKILKIDELLEYNEKEKSTNN
ncbi:hypothetical protein PN290_14415 [Romboutsia sp. 1001216sp1]|uniref:hypothetical protein n=1 Tax=unclassified Romboutsia TaxID=2626894 RepID=UPI0018AA9E2B|nr:MULTISPECIES: hypothetical protein [unclassified Romboutsia]MDB8794897.1 hypothetical protein [Romboutsia sp. 1001216sp1]MDB8797728.1 hypothetical protein [Romboutsia sp. 1001216sp1]MDB8800549.1 hypothetical protein [Romboutsia sp. 1001216sp1]